MTALAIKTILALLAFWAVFRPGALPKTSKALAVDMALLRRTAESGEREAMYRLGWALENGQDVKKDLVEAVKWYKLASEEGHIMAERKLEVLLESVEYLNALAGVALEAQPAEAVSKPSDYDASNDPGFEADFAALGRLENGMTAIEEFIPTVRGLDRRSVPISADEFFDGVKKALPRYMLNAGVKILRGELGGGDGALAARWIARAAQAGETIARTFHGALLGAGYGGIPKDEAAALSSLKSAAKQNECWAMSLLWRLSKRSPDLFGTGEPNFWLCKGAKTGLHYADFDMSRVLAEGVVLPQNAKESGECLARAASKGLPEAVKALRALKRRGALASTGE